MRAVARSAPAKLAEAVRGGRRRRPLQPQGHDHAMRRRTDASQQRLGQRVAEQGLEAEAGDGESRAAQQRQQHARQAELPEDRGGHRIASHYARQRDRVAADQREVPTRTASQSTARRASVSRGRASAIRPPGRAR